MVYDNKDGETGKYIVQDLSVPPEMGAESQAFYKLFAQRLLWLDARVVPGSKFQMNTAWWSKAQPRDPLFEAHVHDDFDEILGFMGSDPQAPYNLNGIIEIAIDGNVHRLTKSTMIFVPAKVTHNPLRLLEVEKPIFHFSVVNGGIYTDMSIYNTHKTE